MGKVFLNDKIIEGSEAFINASDSSFLYGAGLFETMRAYNGVVFRLDDHISRLFASAEKLGINNTYDREFVGRAIYDCLNANNLSNARIRLTLSSGAMSQDGDAAKSTLVVSATEFVSYPAEFYSKGIMVILSPYRQNPFDPMTGHKTTSYFSRISALNFARAKKAAEALWFTTDNWLAEGCISNCFLVKDDTLFTPTLQTPVLAGIARKTVCEIAAAQSIKVVEKDLSIDEVLGAEEIFLTNVIMKIMPVTSVEKHTVGNGKVGEITKKLTKYYDEFFENNCGAKK